MYPIPSEWPWDEVVNVLRYKFREGPGASAVRRGDFELCKTKKRSEIITSTSRLLPGTAITMAVMFATELTNRGLCCPIGHCGSSNIVAYPGGGFKWYVVCLCFIACQPDLKMSSSDCDVWFDEASRKENITDASASKSSCPTHSCSPLATIVLEVRSRW